MKKLKNIFSLLVVALVGLSLTACSNDDLGTNQYQGGVSLNAYGPNPVMRGGQLRFVGSNLDQIASITIPGVGEITNIEVIKSGVPSEIRITVPKDGPKVGYVTLKTKTDQTITTKSQIEYIEGIEVTKIPEETVMPGQTIRIEGDYLNLINSLAFADGVLVSANDFVEQDRYYIDVIVPEEAKTGKLEFYTADLTIQRTAKEEDELTYQTIVSDDALTVGLPSTSKIKSPRGEKDASATAIYGAQGANGVVLITTKRGKAGDAKFNYNGMFAFNRQTKRLDLMNLREYAEYYNSYAAIGEATYTPALSDPSLLGKGTNWQDAVFQTAIQHSHQVSAQGGSDKVQYYVSGSYMDQQGTIIGSEFKRLSFRANLDAQLKKWLKMSVSLTYSDTKDDLKLADSDEGLIGYSLTTIPSIPIYNVDGTYSSVSQEGYTNPNPIAMAMMDNILLKRQKLNGNVYFEVTPIENLVLHTELGFDLGWNRAETYEPMVDLGTWKRASNESRIQKNSNKFWQFKNYLTYSRTFGKHSATAMIGQECWESKYDFTSVYNTGLPSDAVHNPALGSGTPQIGAGFGSSSMASFFTRWTYSYDNRYNATYTYRYDGSSNFGPNKRWAGFHSVAASWRFSNEKFVESWAGKWLSNGKLRVGWGQTGNASIGGYKWGSPLSRMETALGMSYRPAQIANKDIKWESQEQWNIGLDLGFLNDRINLTIDWYNKESRDMLMQMQLPSYMGTSGNGSSALAAG